MAAKQQVSISACYISLAKYCGKKYFKIKKNTKADFCPFDAPLKGAQYCQTWASENHTMLLT